LCFYNTYSGRKEEFVPLNDREVRMYTCGPTVYDFAHIGNFRAYIFEDLLRRHLEFSGYKVIHVMNITDVDDKTIDRARREGISLREYTDRYIQYFFEDLKTLRIRPATFYPRATDHINEMIELIKVLVDKGFAYISDGDVYFRISNFPAYGRLSGISLDRLMPGARVAVDEYQKEQATDFALWKATKPNEPYWDSPFGKGRPGWHIECSAMSMKYLGQTFDIHTGGVDNIFPHHENEIAQSECATGKPFVRYWLHCEHLLVNGEKMSKSKGNFYTLRDLLEKGYTPESIRYLLISTTHYRSKLNFTEEALVAAAESVDRLRNAYVRLIDYQPQTSSEFLVDEIERARQAYKAALDDDLNLPQGMGYAFETIRELNSAIDSERLSVEGKQKAIEFFNDLDFHLDILKTGEETLPKELMELIELREQARKNKDYATADRIRAQLLERGIQLEDTKAGVRWKRVSTTR